MTEISLDILRPILNIKKSEILDYLNKNNLKYFIDKSNFDINISRNYLRHEIIPKFEKINKNFKQNISKTLNYFENLKEFIDEEVKKFLDSFLISNNHSSNKKFFEIKSFNLLSNFLQKEVIRYIYYISNNNSTI
jgi:tRNA(Ile)-lysidine synthase